MIKFHEVAEVLKKVDGESILPRRATKGSCAYDFYAKTNYTVKPNEIVKIWTDVCAEMDEDKVLLVNIRSSMGSTWNLINEQGWIDSDYINATNGGNIGIFLQNKTNEVQTISKGDRIGQGMFVSYFTTVDDEPISEERTGGYGSTGK